eukprot:CAMPEP_0177401016 /NCGR_PEP_ID=MMETSP0368-20130122/59418_1 /TAXON_ID=447022 ORGANISM="Scrippsiella hangoei-like, Strain SHHI-4" /NCGR_SAMPLE_ID=MMETSP0368 /ASSEMBLY_ACC=CAM_ASM_000363 /LENGTH=33 /DNA_ID= /DNA_START= /DNA_END= /DNA_ORIENTATION=
MEQADGYITAQNEKLSGGALRNFPALLATLNSP